MVIIKKSILRRVFLIIMLIIIAVNGGCQPTPTKTVVVNGSDLQEKIEGTPAQTGLYNAPKKWQETLDIKGIDSKIEIDATIDVPRVTAFPVYNVKQIKFDNMSIKPLVNYFTKDKEVIKYKEPTKAELEDQLIQAKTALAKEKADLSSNESDIQDLENMISSIEAQIPDAPENVEPEAITDWSPDKSPSGHFTDDDGKDSGISVSPYTFSYMKGYAVTESVLLLNNKGPIGDIEISKEDVVTAAENILHSLGINYMVAESMKKAEWYSSVENAFASSEKPLSKGYFIKFARNIDGITGITDNGVSCSMKEDFEYKAPLYPEEIQIYIDESGKAQSFTWSNPLEIGGIVNKNISLLSFEDIKQRISSMLTFINSYNSEPTEVSSIKMNMTIVNVKDHPGEAMYVPAWFVYYTQTYLDPGTGKSEQQDYTLVLNAIDGGRVLELPVDISPEIQKQIDQDKKLISS